MSNKYHYPKHIECDFCGKFTRGIIYDHDKESVKCTCCGKELTNVTDSVVVNGIYKNNHSPSTPQN